MTIRVRAVFMDNTDIITEIDCDTFQEFTKWIMEGDFPGVISTEDAVIDCNEVKYFQKYAE